jgi:HipA-like protein
MLRSGRRENSTAQRCSPIVGHEKNVSASVFFASTFTLPTSAPCSKNAPNSASDGIAPDIDAEEPFVDKRLFPFFDGLIPEGWLLEIAENTWKIDPRDRMGLLLACCRDCIGAAGVVPIEDEVSHE